MGLFEQDPSQDDLQVGTKTLFKLESYQDKAEGLFKLESHLYELEVSTMGLCLSKYLTWITFRSVQRGSWSKNPSWTRQRVENLALTSLMYGADELLEVRDGVG